MVNLIAAIALFITTAVTACGGYAQSGRYTELDGMWLNTDLPMTVVVDTQAGTYSGTVLGSTRMSQMTLLEWGEDTLRIKIENDRGGGILFCRFFDDGRILLRKEIEGGIPLIFQRVD